jgi:prophage tail gpP-like protein
MQDKVSLHIDNKKIESFQSYTIESDIYTADDAFSLELANPEIDVREGHRCELYVNESLELTGIIDRVTQSYDKSGLKLKVEGRDLMGLLVDSYCEEFITLERIKVKALAERLLKNVPFINREKIIYQDNFSGKLKKKAKGESAIALLDAPHNFSQIEQGMTIFEVLKDYAGSRGMMFFCLPDGTMVFGKPREKGEPVFNLVCTKDGKDNNVLEGEMVKDISKRYSKITVIGQQQGTDSTETTAINTKEPIENKQWPFYDNGKLRLYKPYVQKDNNDYQSPKLRARMLLERQRHEGFKLNYKVPGHSQNGKNWTINELCSIKDEILNVEGTYLIYSRTFEMSKQGVYTSLKLGIPGGVQ